MFCFTASNKTCITESELLALKEKTNRHMRIRELLLQYSMESTFIVMYVAIVYYIKILKAKHCFFYNTSTSNELN